MECGKFTVNFERHLRFRVRANYADLILVANVSLDDGVKVTVPLMTSFQAADDVADAAAKAVEELEGAGQRLCRELEEASKIVDSQVPLGDYILRFDVERHGGDGEIGPRYDIIPKLVSRINPNDVVVLENLSAVLSADTLPLISVRKWYEELLSEAQKVARALWAVKKAWGDGFSVELME